MGGMSLLTHTDNLSGADNQQGSPSDVELAWLAGLYDGEGWIGVVRSTRGATSSSSRLRYRAASMLTSTSERLIERAGSIMGRARVVFHTVHYKESFNEQRGQWHARKWNLGTASNGATRDLLVILLPYLVEKKEIAKIAIEYVEWRESLPKSGGGKGIPGLAEKAESAIARMKIDRHRNDPPETIRRASASTE